MRSREVERHKKSLALTKVQREVLVGILLGDACLETLDRGRTYRLKVEQSARHEAYVRHLRELFGAWVLSGPRQRTSTRKGVQTTSWVFNTVSHAAFRFYAHQFYGDSKKRVPKLIHRWLTPRGFAYWFMDDGSMKSRQSKGVILNTQGFNRSDVERLIELLKNRFELQCSLRHQKDGDQIYVSGKSYERLVELIDPFMISSMRYK
ncbi:MAG: hypothetical protein GTO14_07635, partial [Anaerolineales bacterium]|nr:hypothetical protein [Anaerolineales bacterium]